MNIATTYHTVIDWIFRVTGMPDCMLHMHAGMILMLGSAVALRKSLSSPYPLAIVAVAEMGNEVMDRLFWHSWRPADTSMDIINTLIWPTAIFVYSRWRHHEAKQRYEAARAEKARIAAEIRQAAHRARRRTEAAESQRKAA